MLYYTILYSAAEVCGPWRAPRRRPIARRGCRPPDIYLYIYIYIYIYIHTYT